MKNKNYETDLPAGYQVVKYINAKSAKTGILFTLLSLIPLLILVIFGIYLVNKVKGGFEVDTSALSISYFCALVILIVYVILHELTHGIVYKAMTKQKLTFGISWSCAFCGVPNIFVYRKTAITAVIMPFLVFTILFIPITIWLFFVNSVFFMEALFILGLHLGGCVGDLYVAYLLLFCYKDSSVLMKDTGPEQFFYTQEK